MYRSPAVPERMMLAVAQHEVEAVGADHRACDDQPQQIGDFEFVQQERSREDDDQDQQEFQDRVFERQRQVYVCEEQAWAQVVFL